MPYDCSLRLGAEHMRIVKGTSFCGQDFSHSLSEHQNSKTELPAATTLVLQRKKNIVYTAFNIAEHFAFPVKKTSLVNMTSSY